ncbi:CinA family protein [Helicobacter sp.]|uniref:CinA family protein n=1 Tax=Helicobacter sp. TaxID=218 RepID=UPI0025C2B0AF|nr:CinA family protein [Helicobacter sp.]
MTNNVSKVIIFLNMDIDSAGVLCAEMVVKCGICWENKDSYARIQGTQRQIDNFELWACEFFKQEVVLGECIESIALEKLKARELTLATAESCTGGLIGYRFTRISGASSVFMGGVISYANTIKEQILEVSKNSLQDFGAVSKPIVEQMLHGALKRFGADVAIASSGIAGPSGGSRQKPVGSVFIGVQAADSSPMVEQHFFPTSNLNTPAKHHQPIDYASATLSYNITAREYIQLEASTKAIEMLIKYLNDK